MKREEIEKLLVDVPEDKRKGVVDQIMATNGNDIEQARKDLSTIEAERDKLKEQLDTATAALDKFKDVDPDKLSAEIESLRQEIADKDTEHANKLAEIEFNGDLEKAIAAAGGKNVKAIKALLDIDALKDSKDRSVAIKDALEATQKDNDYLFGSNEPIDNPTGATGGGGGDAQDAAIRAAMGLPAKE